MKIKLISDIHTEFDRHDSGVNFFNSLPSEGVDLLVVAGDLTTKHYEDNLRRLCEKFPNVVYVLGNHDYWGRSIQQTHEMMQRIDDKIPNLHWLHNKRIEIGGKFIAGTTLWFPRCEIYWCWPDFLYVHDGAEGIFQEHDIAYKFLNENVQKNDIVVTHHLPSQQCVHPRWEGSKSNCYFVGDAEDIILRKEPSHWFFGHTHDQRNLQIWKTHLLCNPRGYPGEHNECQFDTDIIIDTSLDDKS